MAVVMYASVQPGAAMRAAFSLQYGSSKIHGSSLLT